MPGQRPAAPRERSAAPRPQRAARAGKVGSSPATAEQFADRNDFGVEQDNRAEQLRKSDEIRKQPGGDHRGSRQPRAGVDSREAGVGGQEGGPGSFSGGDVDTDVTGVGSGEGLAEGGPDEQAEIGAADTTGGSEQFASGGPAQGRNQPAQSRRDAELKEGDTVDHSGGDATTQGAGTDVESTGQG